TTSSLFVNWTKPMGSSSFYRVQWEGGKKYDGRNVSETFLTISNLTAGEQYKISVTAVAADNVTEGANRTTLKYTSNDNINITWTLPKGRVDHYIVNISDTSSNYTSFTKTTTTTAAFSGLLPGRSFSFTVTAVAGTFTDTSDQFSLATCNRTNSSLHLQWVTSEKMAGAPTITYNITYNHPDDNVSKIGYIEKTDIVLEGLQSGTNYTINITTVGPEQLSSSPVTQYTSTLPNPVQDAKASPISPTSIKVQWSKPLGAREYYLYRVQTYNSTTRALINTITSNSTSYDVPNLEPGFCYSIKITTTVASDTDSSPVEVSSCTMPKAVTNLTVSFVNTTSIQLSWPRQNDYKDSYKYLVEAWRGSERVHNDSTYNETYSFNSLIPGTLYTFNVLTVHEGVQSTIVSGILAIGTTSSLSVSWTKAYGQVSSYLVQLYNDTNSLINDTDLSNETTQFKFDYLKPGVLYHVEVVTKSGPKTSNRSVVSNATFPNPPGSIMVDFQTNSSIRFNWSLPADMDPDQYFTVSTENASNDTKSNWFLMENLESGSKYTVSVVTVGALKYKSTEESTQNYTTESVKKQFIVLFSGPYNVTDLKAFTVNTTAVYLNWTKPYEYKHDFQYRVETTGCRNKTTNSSAESVTFSDLISGTNCTFCVTVMAEDGTEGKETCTTQYTSRGSNDSVLVSWTNPPGNVEKYELLLNCSSGSNKTEELSFHNTSFKFYGLHAAELCSGVMRSHSGPFSEPSEIVTSATYPNPPGNIVKRMQTTSSIELEWGEAPDMEYAFSYHYNLTYTHSQEDVKIPSAKTTYNLSQLLSGTSYMISVTTVGPMDFESEPVNITVTTRPYKVKSLKFHPDEEHINLTWDHPDEYKSTYSFFVSWQNHDKTYVKNTTTRVTSHNITGLAAGTEYNINIITKTSDGTESATKTMSICTSMLVTFHLLFSPICMTLDLNFTIKVETLSCGQPSTPKWITCQTGVTKPLIPSEYGKQVSTKTHNTFTLLIDNSLLNDSKGPVTHVGVLVTSDDTGRVYFCFLNIKMCSCNPKTYSDWKANSAKAYLATMMNYTKTTRRSSVSLDVEIGSGSKWESYANGALDPSGSYRYAVVVCTYLVVDSGKINATKSVCSVSNLSVTDSVNFGFIKLHRSVAVRVEDFEAYYKKQKADSSCGFAEEFEDLKPVGTAQAKLHALALENKPKNRYNNVLPYDSSRVKLSVVHGSPNEDYINANYMPGYLSRKEFIAAQGPLPATVNEFWRMVWEKNVQTLVMLTRCNEQGRVKCEQYWGPGTKYYEDIIVTTTSEIQLEDWTIRDFDIKNVKTTEVRSVRHFHFTAWPDHGVPETTELLISFRHLVREHMNQYSRNSPTVVHCSAGVGRTGTFIAIDRLIFQIERENIVDVYGIVHDLRMHRPLMVQTEDQYVFLNQCALDIIRARTGNNVDLIYQNTAAISIYENVEPKRGY
uniref:protein-tyrosine-phosphatase n=1 Tax=Poecilia mexicana TaxID=48701 RepID=A0A3B3XAX1_9TELE